jgi:MFS family permease
MINAQSVSAIESNLRLTKNQVRGFWAAWGGWTLDGMDSFIYALVLVPALHELLPRSEMADTAANEGFYGGLLFALFLVGWGCSFAWGPIADRFGRVRTLSVTILWYSVFTFLGAVTSSVWQLAAFRFFAGIGIGGEWSIGGTFVAEEWPECRRVQGGAWMHTGYYFGILLAGALNTIIASHGRWRAMFLVGGTPALLVGLIRYGIHEPAQWQRQSERLKRRAWASSLGELFAPEYRRRTVVNCLCVLVSIIGLWAGSVYVPAAVTQLAKQSGITSSDGARFASYATILLAITTVLGCLVMPWFASRFGRKPALTIFFLLMASFIPLGFGYAFYLPVHALRWFFVCLCFIGFGGANFALYTFWLPEQYRTNCRASAFALATSLGRFGGAGATFLVGSGVAAFHTIGIPVALTAVAFVAGIVIIQFGEETVGNPLPL